MRYIVLALAILFLVVSVPAISEAHRCSAIAAASYGEWKPALSAPRDGTTVELLQTYGVAPWYGLFKWEKNRGWTDVKRPERGMSESECLFWRPYKGAITKYVDPTGGAQDTVAYWCAYLQRPYDRKTDSCK